MTVFIRPPALADIETVTAISSDLYPEVAEQPSAWSKALEQPDPHSRYYVAEVAGAVAGYGCLRPDLPRRPELRRYRIHIGVAPERQGQGAGRALYGRLMHDLAEMQGVYARARVRSGQRAAIQFLQRRGFTEHGRMVHLECAVPGVDLQPWLPVADRVDVRSLRQIREQEGDWLLRLYDLYNRCGADVVATEPYEPPTVEQFSRMLESPNLPPDAFLVALDGDAFAGFSYAVPMEQPGVLMQAMTGVQGPHRGRGIATALKVRMLQYAWQHSYETVQTATQHPAMLAVNLKLGFAVTREEVRLQRLLQQ